MRVEMCVCLWVCYVVLELSLERIEIVDTNRHYEDTEYLPPILESISYHTSFLVFFSRIFPFS